MAKKPKTKPRTTREAFPWLLLIAFLASIYFFWILPQQLGSRPTKVEYSNPIGITR